MCRLFGLRANRAVDVHFSFVEAPHSLLQQSREHPHGWGIAWYDERGAQVFKEPVTAARSRNFPRMAQEVKSSLIIAHIRKRSRGAQTPENTHPFRHHNWVFAHNGTITTGAALREELRPEFQQLIQGQTDSEVYFYWLLQHIQEQGDPVRGIAAAVRQLRHRHRFTGLNFLLSEGQNLYAFRYGKREREYYSLYFLERPRKPPPPLHHTSPWTGQLIASKFIRAERAVLVASEKLTPEESWQELEWGSLLVVSPDLRVQVNRLLSG